MSKHKWFIYIPDEGEWPIKYSGDAYEKAKAAHLKWAKRKRLPAGNRMWFREAERIAKQIVKENVPTQNSNTQSELSGEQTEELSK